MADEETPDLIYRGIRMTGKPANTYWDLCCKDGIIHSVDQHQPLDQAQDPNGRLLAPSLCHPHIHIDKCFLFSHPKYADLEMTKGDFAEAMTLTSEAKSRFEPDDLMDRGRALIEESIGFGVTHMRAFVEVDLGVSFRCLDAGLALKEIFKDRCYIQICVFAQDPIFSGEDNGKKMTGLLKEALTKPGVEVLGSTPYVEKTREQLMRNIKWTMTTAMLSNVHLDFHMDYNLDPSKEAFALATIAYAKYIEWPCDPSSSLFKTIVFGHCTRLTLFTKGEWYKLREKVGNLPVSFIGLPTSDIFMMGRPGDESGGGNRARGTLQVVQMIEKYGFNAAIGINNVGNAFTPQGSCDPLSLAGLGVGIYQASKKTDAEILLQCISGRAKEAIGVGRLSRQHDVELKVGDRADFVVFGKESSKARGSFRSRKTTQELVYDPGHERITVFGGRIVSQ